jgi:hypothetical protein
LKSRRDRRKEKDKKVSKKKRDSDASSVKSDGEPNLINIDRDKTDDLVPVQQQQPQQQLLHQQRSAASSHDASESLRIDDEGYTIRPKDDLWNTEKTSGFYSSSDADSGIH